MTDPCLVLSPHFDDAALSCGQFLAGRPDAWVATVFTATPMDRRMSTGYDQNCGFSSAEVAMRRRTEEDNEAMSLLRARALRFDFLDNQYLDDKPGDRWEVALMIGATIGRLILAGGRLVLAPLGIEHPDHVTVSEAAVTACAGFDVDLILYEELPNRVLHPTFAAERWLRFGWPTSGFAEHFVGTGPVAVKEEAIACYRSQLWALDRAACLMPERYWAVPRPWIEARA